LEGKKGDIPPGPLGVGFNLFWPNWGGNIPTLPKEFPEKPQKNFSGGLNILPHKGGWGGFPIFPFGGDF